MGFGFDDWATPGTESKRPIRERANGVEQRQKVE